MEEKVRRFERWYENQPKFKQFLALTGIISAAAILAIGLIIVLAMIVIWTFSMAIFVSPWFFLLVAAEVAIALGALFAMVIVND